MFKVNKQCSTIDLNPLADVKTAEAALRVPAARHVGSCSLRVWRLVAGQSLQILPSRTLPRVTCTYTNPTKPTLIRDVRAVCLLRR